MTPQLSDTAPGRRRMIRRLLAGAATAAALAVPALPVAAGAATVPAAHRATVAAAVTGGALKAWGMNNDGQVGNGTQSAAAPLPVNVKLPAGVAVTQVRAGCFFTVALTSTGRVLAWGDNSSGQLGIGTTGGTSTVPVFVHLPGGTKITAVRAGCDHALALTSTGSVLAWGDNSFGELGDGTTTNRDTPVFAQLPPGVVAVAISAGYFHSLALASNHTAVFAWGRNQFGQLGNDTTSNGATATPVLAGITGLTVTSLAATFGDSYAVTSTGRVLSWGDNTFGELGTKLSLTDVTTPIFVALPSGVTVSSATGGAFHVLARTTTGHVLAWGFNGHGQLGDGTSNDEFQPKQIPLPGGATVKALSAGNFHSLALTTTGKVFAWGEGTEGELGDNLLADIFSAVKVHLPTTFAVTGIAAGPGADHSLAIGHKV